MRISDWSSDVCSSDLVHLLGAQRRQGSAILEVGPDLVPQSADLYGVRPTEPFGPDVPLRVAAGGSSVPGTLGDGDAAYRVLRHARQEAPHFRTARRCRVVAPQFPALGRDG